jgi:hypothetical protein
MDTTTHISWGQIENGALDAKQQGTFIAKPDETADVRYYLSDLEQAYYKAKAAKRLSLLNAAVLEMNLDFRNKCANHLQKKAETLAQMMPKEKMDAAEKAILTALRNGMPTPL